MFVVADTKANPVGPVIIRIPLEVRGIIWSFLDDRELGRSCVVSRAFNDNGNHDHIWAGDCDCVKPVVERLLIVCREAWCRVRKMQVLTRAGFLTEMYGTLHRCV